MDADQPVPGRSRPRHWSWLRGLPLYGASRTGISPAKEAIGKNPERYKPVNPGTVYYNPMRILLGSIAMVDEGEAGGITSPDYVVLRGRPGILHHRVFYYWLRSTDGEALIRKLARGGVRQRILFNRLAKGMIPVLPWNVQERLAEQLAVIPRARAAALARLAAAEALPAAYLREVFEGPQVSEWKTMRFGELVNSFDGLREPVRAGDRRPGPYPYYGTSGIIDKVDRFLFDGEYLLVAEDGANLIARATPIAFVAVANFG